MNKLILMIAAMAMFTMCKKDEKTINQSLIGEWLYEIGAVSSTFKSYVYTDTIVTLTFCMDSTLVYHEYAVADLAITDTVFKSYSRYHVLGSKLTVDSISYKYRRDLKNFTGGNFSLAGSSDTTMTMSKRVVLDNNVTTHDYWLKKINPHGKVSW